MVPIDSNFSHFLSCPVLTSAYFPATYEQFWGPSMAQIWETADRREEKDKFEENGRRACFLFMQIQDVSLVARKSRKIPRNCDFLLSIPLSLSQKVPIHRQD
jgi:hypothetical protein